MCAYKARSPIPVAEGGTGDATLTNHGVLLGQGTSGIAALAVASSGTVLAGVTGSNPAFTATPSVTSITISNAPTAGTDGANKNYVDSVVAGLNFQAACYAATTATLTATYSNGSSGVGATLTNSGALAAFSVDGVSPALNSRILVKNQSTDFQNGIYTVTTVGSGAVAWVLTRATDYDTIAEITPGDVVPVQAGTVNATTFWIQTATVTAIGTDPITFVQFFGAGANSFVTDSGTATAAGGSITIAGGTNLISSGSGSTVTLDFNGSTNHAVQVGNGSLGLTNLTVGTNGQVLVGSTAADPVFATLSSSNGSITYSTGAGTLGLTVTQASTSQLGGSTLATNAEAIAGTDTTKIITADDLKAKLGAQTNHAVLVGAGTAAAVTAVATSATSGVPLVSQGSSADPVFGTAAVAGGGTGATTLTGILTGNGTSAFTASAVSQYTTLVAGASNAVVGVAPSATSGVPLISQGSSSNPAYGTAVVAGGGTGNTTFTAYSVICAGTTATGAFQNVSGLGSSGQVLTSNGAGALPSWQAAGGGGITWSVITADQTAVVNNGYICNKASALVLTLPTTAAVGTIIEVTGMNTALGWKIAQNSGQTIHWGTVNTTTGTGGYIQSSATRDWMKFVCVVANTEWNACCLQGSPTFV